MKKSLLCFCMVFAISSIALAQGTVSKGAGSVKGSTSASSASGVSGPSFSNTTGITAELENSLDVRKAKVGDEVVLKTKKSVKENGQTVIQKGSTLTGRVTEVQERAKGVAASKVGVIFHTLVQNGENMPINATITSILRTSVSGGAGDDVFASGTASSGSQTSTQSSSSGGGLLGGVGNTVGNVVNTTTSTVSNVANTMGNVVGSTVTTVGRTTSGVTTNIPGLQVSQSAEASASGGSTLTLNGGNLKLEHGTTFNLNIVGSGSASSTPSKGKKN